MALFIDSKKAFDTLDWNFLFKTLEVLNFGPQIVRWIKTFYNDCSSCVMNNGYASEFFKLQRGELQELFSYYAQKYLPTQSDKIRQLVESRFLTENSRSRNTLMIQLSSFLTLNLLKICLNC